MTTKQRRGVIVERDLAEFTVDMPAWVANPNEVAEEIDYDVVDAMFADEDGPVPTAGIVRLTKYKGVPCNKEMTFSFTDEIPACMRALTEDLLTD